MNPPRFVRLSFISTVLALPLCAQPAGPASAVDAATLAQQINSGRLASNYPMPYAPSSVEEITAVLGRVLTYLDGVTPARLVDRTSHQEITDFTTANPNAMFERGDFQLLSYEWGVTYSGMLLAGEATGDARFTDYVGRRLKFVADIAPVFRAQIQARAAAPEPTAAPGQPGFRGQIPLRNLLAPRSLDDCGALTAAMIKALRASVGGELRPLVDNTMRFISSGQFRFPDGTLARNRPLANALWLDDLYMSVPALAQMGKLTGEARYFDDAAKQILQFSERMFVKEKGLYLHGWIQGMDPHPAFHWGRANGWAVLSMTELLNVLPENHPSRAAILAQYRAHVRGLVACQGGNGLWHQLLDRPDSYEETSASAIFVYCIARGINQGWLDPLAYGPTASLGWNAVAGKVNPKGQVEGTCVGTGMGFDPAFYYYRPVNVLAAHGYGPVLMAGAEMISLRKNAGKAALVSDGAVQFARTPSNF